jgi:hypothetical protein
MPRARNLKPGFFSNEDLAECSPWARLCFAGLWTLADREGRMEDRPKRIKGELFRFDTVDVEPLLRELERGGFIVRYEIDGARFIQVSKFSHHQTPHYSEKPSVIKPPPLQENATKACVDNSGSAPGVEPSSRGGLNPLNPDILNPDILNPDSPNPEPGDAFVVAAPSGKPATEPATVPAARAAAPPRGTRLPAEWTLPETWRDWALTSQHGWTEDTVRLEAEKFADHWHAKTGQNATKADWQATWRNWCRNARPAQANGQRVSATDRRIATIEALTGRRRSHERPAEPADIVDIPARVVA